MVPERFSNKLDFLLQNRADRLVRFVWKNIIPRRVRELLDFLWPRRLRTIPKEKLQAICLQLTDIQLITGASIFIVLYSRHCTVTQYHFYIGLELSYLSFITFQGMLLAVVDVLHERLFTRVWRYIWILTLSAGIFASRFILWNDYFMVDRMYGLSVQCVFDKLAISEWFTPKEAGMLTIDVVVFFWSLWSITVLLFPSVSGWPPMAQITSFIYWFFSFPSRALVRVRNRALLNPADAETTKFKIKRRIITVAFVMFLSFREIVFSLCFDLLRVYTLLIGSIYGILYQRRRAADHGREGDENEWGFGQILPLLLLALPISTFAEEIWST